MNKGSKYFDSSGGLSKVEPGGSKEGGIGKEGVVDCKGGRSMVKSWKPRKVRPKMVLGRDVGLCEISFLSFCTLVGWFSYWELSKQDIGWWVDEQ